MISIFNIRCQRTKQNKIINFLKILNVFRGFDEIGVSQNFHKIKGKSGIPFLTASNMCKANDPLLLRL